MKPARPELQQEFDLTHPARTPMTWILFVVATLFVLLGAACVLLVVVGLPGTWLMILLAIVIEIADGLYLPADDRQTFGWWILGVCLLLAFLGEVVEFLASAAGAKYGGASRRGMIGSLIGAFAGVIGGTIFIPVPVVGSIIGAMIGAAVGAILGEMTASEMTFRKSLKPAQGAAAGRLLGTLGKIPFAVVVWLMLSVAAFWP